MKRKDMKVGARVRISAKHGQAGIGTIIDTGGNETGVFCIVRWDHNCDSVEIPRSLALVDAQPHVGHKHVCATCGGSGPHTGDIGHPFDECRMCGALPHAGHCG